MSQKKVIVRWSGIQCQIRESIIYTPYIHYILQSKRIIWVVLKKMVAAETKPLFVIVMNAHWCSVVLILFTYGSRQLNKQWICLNKYNTLHLYFRWNRFKITINTLLAFPPKTSSLQLWNNIKKWIDTNSSGPYHSFAHSQPSINNMRISSLKIRTRQNIIMCIVRNFQDFYNSNMRKWWRMPL